MRLLIIGAGGHAKVVVDAARASGMSIAGILGHRGDAETVLGEPVFHDVSGVEADAFIVAVGDNRLRAREFEHWTVAGLAPATVIHPSAVIGAEVEIGEGTFVAAGVIVNPAARIGRNAILNTGCTVDHDCTVGDHALVGPTASMCGGSHVAEGVLLGAGANVVPGRTVGAWSIIGAGAAVVSDVPDDAVYAGVPAREVAPTGREEHA